MEYIETIHREWERASERDRVKKRQAEKKRQDPVWVRGQIGGMFGHAFVNMTEKSEKLSQAKNKPGPFFSQWGLTEAFHCQNYNRGFSDAGITSAGGNSVPTTPQNYQTYTKDSFQCWTRRGHMHTYTYTNSQPWHQKSTCDSAGQA